MEQEKTAAVAVREAGGSQMSTLRSSCEKQLALFSPANIKKSFPAVRTMNDSLALSQEEAPCLKAMAREGNRESVEALVAIHLVALDEFLDLNHRLTDANVDFIAEQVVEEFGGSLSFIDVELVMRNAKKGVYGRFYERLSAPDVLEWFRQYYEERINAAEERSRKRDNGLWGEHETRLRVKTMAETEAEAAANNEYIRLKNIIMENEHKLQEL